ncbi:MAG: NAD-dependent epimerase/dehydratase family protein [Vicinamibacterales bacterium]
MARYFVTGGTGFLGAEVAKQLLSRGHRVAVLVRDPARAMLLARLGAEVHRGDVTDPESLRGPMSGADGVFHLAAWFKTGHPGAAALAEAVNVGGTRHVLAAMRELGIRKGVYTSTLAVNSDTHGVVVDESYRYRGPHLTVYDRTKWQAHYEVALPMMAAGLPLVVVQPGVVYGPGDTGGLRAVFVAHLRRRLPLVPARTAFCWGHIEDTARAHLDAMDKGRPGQSYFLAGPAHTLAEAVALAAVHSRRAAPLAAVPPVVFRGAARLSRVVEALLPLPAALSAETLAVLGGATYLGASDKARRELGFAPRPLAAGLRHLVEHELRQLGVTLPA